MTDICYKQTLLKKNTISTNVVNWPLQLIGIDISLRFLFGISQPTSGLYNSNVCSIANMLHGSVHIFVKKHIFSVIERVYCNAYGCPQLAR